MLDFPTVSIDENAHGNRRTTKLCRIAGILMSAAALAICAPGCFVEQEAPANIDEEASASETTPEQEASGTIASDSNIEMNDVRVPNNPAEAMVVSQEQALLANKGIILIDRTGSMTTRRSNGYTRCRDARAMASSKVDEFFQKYGGTAVSIWTFNGDPINGNRVVKLTSYVGSATAKAAINNLSMEGCSGNTPLADAICMAADELYALRGTTTRPNMMTILTDGGENSSIGTCKGTTNDVTDPTSWRYKARQRVSGYFPYVQVNPQFWTGSTWINAKGFDPETGKAIAPLPKSAVLCSTQDDCDHKFLYSLAADSAGTYELVKDNNTQYPCAYNTCPPPYYDPLAWVREEQTQ